jgi:glycosyltransferase involved in cell wall biosynthesis
MKPSVLMIAYTHYESDPRVIREAEAAVHGGYEVHFVALRREHNPPVEVIRGVTVHRLNQGRYRGGRYASYLLSYIEFFCRCVIASTRLFFKQNCRIIHVNNMPDFLVFSTFIPKLFGAKVILDIHDPMPNTFASKFRSGDKGFCFRMLLWQELLSVAYADRTITVHDPVKHGILVKHGISADAIDVIANFADEDVFPLLPTYTLGEKVRLVFHGTILERSGLRNLVLALSKLENKDRVEVRIIGEGDFSAELKRLISELGLSEMVHFDNRSYPVREIPRRLADCHLGLVPLEISSVTNYALPLKLLEYTSMGLPVITVRSAAITYYFKEGDCLFYQWDDVESLRRALDEVARNPKSLLQYRERATVLRETFLWSKERDKYVALLNELCGTPKPADAILDAHAVAPGTHQ